jgi:hypothetical protein
MHPPFIKQCCNCIKCEIFEEKNNKKNNLKEEEMRNNMTWFLSLGKHSRRLLEIIILSQFRIESDKTGAGVALNIASRRLSHWCNTLAAILLSTKQQWHTSSSLTLSLCCTVTYVCNIFSRMPATLRSLYIDSRLCTRRRRRHKFCSTTTANKHLPSGLLSSFLLK